jgi:hypothetical protein
MGDNLQGDCHPFLHFLTAIVALFMSFLFPYMDSISADKRATFLGENAGRVVAPSRRPFIYRLYILYIIFPESEPNPAAGVDDRSRRHAC